MKLLTQSDIDRYVASPNHCPYCESDQIEGRDRDVEDGVATQEIACLDCDAGWKDVYRLIGFSVHDRERNEMMNFRGSKAAVSGIAP